MPAGQGEELADGPRAGLAQGLEQSLDHGAEHFVYLEVDRRPGQPWIAPVQERGAELMQSPDRTVQQGPDDRVAGAGQRRRTGGDHQHGTDGQHDLHRPGPVGQGRSAHGPTVGAGGICGSRVGCAAEVTVQSGRGSAAERLPWDQ